MTNKFPLRRGCLKGGGCYDTTELSRCEEFLQRQNKITAQKKPASSEAGF